jgi:epoxyqueuosine reductase
VGAVPDRLFAARVFREEAENEGFTRFGVARAGEAPRYDRFANWIAEGRHAGMRYLQATQQVRRTPDALLRGARSVVCLAAPYSAAPYVASDGARFARYARGTDYHGTLRRRALRAAERTWERLGGGWGYRVCVDSTPLAERSFAAAAGVGWIGKNGCLIDPVQGSYLLLAEILTDLDLPEDEPIAERCGACVLCLEACPTEAFLSPGLLDSARCLAYWTIEHRGVIPDPWKNALDDSVFGCDICQEVCPWNASLPAVAAQSSQALPMPNALPPTRAEILAMGGGEWRRRFGNTAVNRAGRRGLQRNAAASAGARRDAACLPVLQNARGVGEAGLADAAGWATARLQTLPL